jgi:hypothetical protein
MRRMTWRVISAWPYQRCHLSATAIPTAAATAAAGGATDAITVISIAVASQLQRPQHGRGVANGTHIRGLGTDG